MSDPQRKPWLVYSSSPDRGLDVMFEMWPSIREGAETAGIKKPQLHYAYSPIYFQFKDSGAFPHLKSFHAKLERLEAEAGEGLVNHGSLSQPELAKLFRESMVWSYPDISGEACFPEIYCISAAEAQAAGCVPVTMKYGALPETAPNGLLIEPDLDNGRPTAQWRQQFIQRCVEVLVDREFRSQTRQAVQGGALELDWAGVCDQWELALLTKIGRGKTVANA